MKLKIISAAHHRNGVAGAPFDVVLFRERGRTGGRKVAILFEQEAQCAVLDIDKLAGGDIAFGSNSWRGDNYEPTLRKAIDENQHAIDADSVGGKRVGNLFTTSTTNKPKGVSSHD
jgi:hypothetical protein